MAFRHTLSQNCIVVQLAADMDEPLLVHRDALELLDLLLELEERGRLIDWHGKVSAFLGYVDADNQLLLRRLLGHDFVLYIAFSQLEVLLLLQ